MMSRVTLPNSGKTYKFGFNGKMNDDDVKGLGNQQDYGMRIYDPRVGRFLSVDPITRQYPQLTPYQFVSNTPNWAVDMDGLEGALYGPGMTLSTAEKADPGKNWQRTIEWWNSPASPGVARAYEYSLGYSEGTITSNRDVVAAMFAKWVQAQNHGGSLNIPNTRRPNVSAPQQPDVEIPATIRPRMAVTTDEAVPVSGNNQATAANSGNPQAAVSNTGFNRPSWQQTEADVVTPDYRQQVAFKNGNEVPANTKRSVRPEGYKPGESIEAKNYTLTNEAGIKSMIRNVSKQVRQRQANLPANTVQNITLDVRGQNLTTKQLMTIRSRLMTQTGSKNINITYKTN
jgi:RHS repeat-associated protein